MADYWTLPDFGRRYNTLRLSKNRQVATYGQYTLEAIVSRIESKSPGLITEKVLKEILNNVFREGSKEKTMDLLIEDLGMTKEDFWRNEAPQKPKPITPTPKLVKAPEVIQQPKPQNTQPQKTISTPQPKQTPVPSPVISSTQPKNRKKHLKITSHVPDYSFIFVFSEGKIDIYEDKKEIVDRTKEGVWVPPADLKYGSKLAPRTIEVDVTI